MQFGEPLHVYDDTSVPFNGMVYIHDTVFPGKKGCPLSDVEVCLVHERNIGVQLTNSTIVCGSTEADGTYSVPVIIGSRVDYVDLFYHGHAFRTSLNSNFKPGVVIEAGSYYGDNDFVDVQKAKLRKYKLLLVFSFLFLSLTPFFIVVEVVGGLCNHPLGTSFLRVKIASCPDFEGQSYIQKSIKQLYGKVPAHILEIEVRDIKDKSGSRIRSVN